MDKRQALIDAAAQLSHIHGFGGTTLAMVAEESGVPLGNVYYYFRTKEALARAVLERRTGEVEEMLDCCAGKGSAKQQLLGLLRSMRASAGSVAERGCPFGRISQDICAEGRTAKAAPVAKMIEWCEGRMRELGQTAGKARENALHLISALQGVSLLAYVNHDPELLRREVRTLERWVKSL